MAVRIGNAPCSWGVEFANDPRNTPYQQVLKECALSGYSGIELGPIGYAPDDPSLVAEALRENELELTAGVVFQPFHDSSRWTDVRNAVAHTIRGLLPHGARHLVLIDSIAKTRAPTTGRFQEAPTLSTSDWTSMVERVRTACSMGVDAGLTVSIHGHAGGFLDFQPEIERLLDEIPENLLSICLDPAHHAFAGFDPLAFLHQNISRVSYLHLKDVDPLVKKRAIDQRMNFYDACAQGLFPRLGEGSVDFSKLHDLLLKSGFDGWCTVEQDCEPGSNQALADAQFNRDYLHSIRFQ